MTDECSLDNCRDRPGFGDVVDPSLSNDYGNGEYCVAFRCPEHGDKYWHVYTYDGMTKQETDQ